LHESVSPLPRTERSSLISKAAHTLIARHPSVATMKTGPDATCQPSRSLELVMVGTRTLRGRARESNGYIGAGRHSTFRKGLTWTLASAPGCGRDRKSTRLNSSHVKISYAV